MNKILLRPYHGQVWYCHTWDELHKAFKRLTGKDYEYEDDPNGGRYIGLSNDTIDGNVWVVYGKQPEILAHEMSHVLLHVFNEIGHDPRHGDGEPFCYMLTHLMTEASKPVMKAKAKKKLA